MNRSPAKIVRQRTLAAAWHNSSVTISKQSPFSLATWGELIDSAYRRIQSLITKTPVEDVSATLPGAQARVFFKMENLQQTGSFKLRGATNKIKSLTPVAAQRGVIAASNGNHGMAVAEAARVAGIQAEVYVSEHVAEAKATRIQELGATIRRHGTDPLHAELAARSAAESSGKPFISPYNDAEVIAGQGTVAFECVRQTGQIDAIFVTVGGGGLISGIGAYMKYASPMTEIVGCWPANSPVLYESMKAGQILDVPEQPTVSESTAGGLEQKSITLDICRNVIDRSVLVTEDEIMAAMRRVRDVNGWLIEGAAGVALAAFEKEMQRYAGKTVVIVICGGNISPKVKSALDAA
jgi:threonine dehydratase